MKEQILILGYGKENYAKVISDFESRDAKVHFLDAGDFDMTRDAASEKLQTKVKSRTESIDRLLIDIANRPIICTGSAKQAQDYEALLKDYDGIALGTVRAIHAFLPLLDLGKQKQIAILTSERSSIYLNEQTEATGKCVATAAVNRLMSLLWRMLRPEGYSIRLCAVDRGFGYVCEYLTRQRCFEAAGSERDNEHRFAMHDAMAREIPW